MLYNESYKISQPAPIFLDLMHWMNRGLPSCTKRKNLASRG